MGEIPKECRFCAYLGLGRDQLPDYLPGEADQYRCAKGHFDVPVPSGGTVPRTFAWSGIWRPNKSVKQIQELCNDFEVHPQVTFIGKKGKSEAPEV